MERRGSRTQRCGWLHGLRGFGLLAIRSNAAYGAALLALLSVVAPAAAEVYLTKEQALILVLGADTEQSYEPKPLDPELTARIEERGLLGERKEQAHFFVARRNGAISGYALIDSEVGKHLPITYIVGFTPTGQVTRVEMMVFREVRGWEARERRFMAQFEGKGSSDRLQIGAGLKNVTGATLSSRAIAKGVQRALLLWQHFYGDKSEQR